MSLSVNPQIKTVTLPGPERSKRTVVFLRNTQAKQPQVLFSGDGNSLLNSPKAKALGIGALLAALAAPLGMARAQEAPVQPPQAPNQAVQLPGIQVNQASDLQAQLKKEMTSPIAVLANNSLLSKETQQELHNLLVQFDKEGVGQLAVVEIADTNRGDMNSLATDIFNQMQLGQQGKNNGVLLLLNNKGIQDGTRGKQMTIKPGAGLKGTFTADASTQLLIRHAVPHLKQKDYDGAVKETVNAIKDLMTQAAKGGGVPANNLVGNHNNNNIPANPNANNNDPVIDGQTLLIIGLVALLILIAVIAASKGACDGMGSGGGYSGGGYSGGGYSGGGYSGGGYSGGSSSSSSSDSGGYSGGGYSGGGDSGGYSGGGGGFSDGGGGSI